MQFSIRIEKKKHDLFSFIYRVVYMRKHRLQISVYKSESFITVILSIV